jgi:hypothetical protein
MRETATSNERLIERYQKPVYFFGHRLECALIVGDLRP